MALEVEDGTGKSNAESFISVLDAEAYLDARGETSFSGLATEALQEEALRKATDYMEQEYRSRWDGYLNTQTQALSFPRTHVRLEKTATGNVYLDDDVVPTEVANACAEFALKTLTEDLSVSLDRKTTREKIGEIEVEYSGFESQQKQYTSIERIIKKYFAQKGFSTEVNR